VLLRPLEDRVQPPVIRDPRKGAHHHPTNSNWEELSVAATGDRLDGDVQFLPGLGQALASVAEIAQRRSPEPLADEFTQHRNDAFGLPPDGVAKACVLWPARH